MTANSDSLTTRLGALDSCAVSDALDSLGLPGTVTGLIRLATNKRISGRVVTVELGLDKPVDQPVRHLCTGAIEAARTGDVIVVEQRTGIDAAGWGGVLSNAAKRQGIAGVIVDGPARDIDESMALDFPVFARSATAHTARGRVHEQRFNGPIRVGNVSVHPGDLVIADASAVVFIGGARAEEVVAVAERIVAKEVLMTRAVRDGQPVAQVMGADYEHMLGTPED